MSSKSKNRLLGTLSLRLTILYCGLFILSTVIAFWIIYSLTASALQKNEDRDLLGDITEFQALMNQGGWQELREELLWEVQKEGSNRVFFRLFDTSGTMVFSTDVSAWKSLRTDHEQIRNILVSGQPIFTDLSSGDETEARMITAPIGDDHVLQIGESRSNEEEYLEIFSEVFGRVMIIMIILAAGIGWFMARRALAGVEDVTQAALNITRGDFAQRVPLKSRGYEIERLATTFNHMIDRIQSLLKGIHEVTDNIAHDLRSPLASIRGTTELAIMNADGIDEYRDMARNTIEECDRLIATINAMLDISEAEAGATKLDIQRVNLCQLVQQACDLYLPVAEDNQQDIAFHGPTDCYLEADLKMIQRLVSNLLDNALKYTPPGGSVNITIKSPGDRIILVIEDTGVGIDEKDLPFVFERFFRCDHSRGKEGSGLGLSMALAIVKAHGGTIDVASRPGEGSRFTVCLPLHPVAFVADNLSQS